MTYQEALERVINDGIDAAKEDYKGDDEEKQAKLAGSIEGFEACRDKTPEELVGVLAKLRGQTHMAMIRVHEQEISSNEYWAIRCRELETEWVCNCISALLMNQGMPVIVPPTARAVMKMAEIVGAKDS